MRIQEILSEQRLNESVYTRPLVIVDIQPAYQQYFAFSMDELVEFLNRHKGKKLMYVNAEETYTTEDTIDDIKFWWYENGLNEDIISSAIFYDKGYGNLREAIDSGAADADIIAVIREMFRQGVNDSRMLFQGDEEKQEEVFGEDNIEWIQNGISIMDLHRYDLLKQLSPFYMIGGGKNECLKEVMLMLSALNIKYKLINRFVY